jgi:hypothetical protein
MSWLRGDAVNVGKIDYMESHVGFFEQALRNRFKWLLRDEWLNVQYGNGVFVAASGGRILTSPDGVMWKVSEAASPVRKDLVPMSDLNINYNAWGLR